MNPVTKYVLNQLDSMHQTPEMYGSKESVELQYLQYLETWIVSVCPDLDASEPRFVLNMYQQHRVQKGFPATQPLSEVLPSSRALVDVLQEFRSVLDRKLDEVVKCIIRAMSDFEPTPPPKDTRPGKLLAVFHEGVLTLLEHQGNDLEIEVENVGEDGLLESVGDPPAPGVWVWSGGFIDGGEGDWPGTREYVLDGEWAPASKEEWSAFQRGDWTWGEPPPTTQRIL